MSMQRRAIAATRRGRAKAEALMIDTCIVERLSGTETNPTTGVVSDSWETIYEGKCKVQGRSAVAATPTAGKHMYTIEQLMVSLPITAHTKPGDRDTIVSAEIDEDLIDIQLQLTELDRGTFRTADRWNVDLVTA